MNELEKLFKNIIDLKYNLQDIAAIVQNEMKITDDMIDEWKRDVNTFYKKFKKTIRETHTELKKRRIK